MGLTQLIQDCVTQSTALSDSSKKGAGQVDAVQQVIASVQSQLQDSVTTTQQAVRSMETRVTQMKTDLAGFIQQVQNAMADSATRISGLQTAVQADASMVAGLDSMVHDAVTQVRNMIQSLTTDVANLQTQEQTMVKTLEDRVAKSETAVAALLQLAEDTRTSLDQRRATLDTDYGSLTKALSDGHTRIYGDYGQASDSAQQGLGDLEQQLKTSSDQQFAAIQSAFVDDSGQKLSAMSKDMTDAVTNLKHVCDTPQSAADTTFVQLKAQLDKTQGPLQNVDTAFKQADSVGLIDQ